MSKIYMVTCTEVNYNVGGKRTYIDIHHDKKDAIATLIEYHKNTCPDMDLSFDKYNKFIECTNCIFKENNNKYIRKYCDKCKQEEIDLFVDFPNGTICCNKCIYEKNEEEAFAYYVRNFCDKCILFCKCATCTFDLLEFTIIINKNIRQCYQYLREGDSPTYLALDIFDSDEDYSTTWNS